MRLAGPPALANRQAAPLFAAASSPCSCPLQVMLGSLRAASLGINLTTAYRMVLFDLEWNPVYSAQVRAGGPAGLRGRGEGGGGGGWTELRACVYRTVCLCVQGGGELLATIGGAESAPLACACHHMHCAHAPTQPDPARLNVTPPPHDTAQAVARIHRLGQRRPTFVYRLVYAATGEERVYETCVDKEELFSKVRTAGGLAEVFSPFPIRNQKVEDASGGRRGVWGMGEELALLIYL